MEQILIPALIGTSLICIVFGTIIVLLNRRQKRNYVQPPEKRETKSEKKRVRIADLVAGDSIYYFNSKGLYKYVRGIVENNSPLTKTIYIKQDWKPNDGREEYHEYYVEKYDAYCFKDFDVLNNREEKKVEPQRITYDLIPLLEDKMHDAIANGQDIKAGILRDTISKLNGVQSKQAK